MGFRLAFGDVQDKKDLDGLRDFLLSQDLEYPGYDSWVDRAVLEVEEGVKRPILAVSREGMIGDLIMQRHKAISGVIELKNIRVAPDWRSRGIARFLIRQAEVEAEDNSYGVVCDTRGEATRQFGPLLRSMNYEVLYEAPIYDKNNLDTIWAKSFGKTPEGIFMTLHRV